MVVVMVTWYHIVSLFAIVRGAWVYFKLDSSSIQGLQIDTMDIKLLTKFLTLQVGGGLLMPALNKNGNFSTF